MSLISIVVPVYFSAASLPELMERFHLLSEQNRTDSFEFIFVDDGSRDNSFEVLARLAEEDERIQVVKLSRNFGSNKAILAGLSYAHGDAVGVIAADLQDPPELLHEMFIHWREGKKVVLAARKDRDDPGLTSLLADLFYALFRRLAIKTMPERGFDFFVVDRQVCDIVTHIQENNTYLMGLILWLGFDPEIIYYHRQARKKEFGKSRWTLVKKVEYFLDSFVAFSYLPLRLVSFLGVLFSLIGFLYGVLVVVLRLTRGFDVEGWTSTMLVILITGGLQMAMLGVLGEYLWRNLDETRKRPRFVVDKTIKAWQEGDQKPE
jgi:dolichol-phosphate mannosyltransferase